MERLTDTIQKAGIDEQDPMRVFGLDLIEEGIEQGIEQERARAEEKMKTKMKAQAKLMKAKGYPLEDIAEITLLAMEEIVEL